MCPYDKQIESIKNKIVERYRPKALYLFGSCAKGMVTKHSDIDMCVIIDTSDKRALVQEILMEIDTDRDVDIVVYGEKEWDVFKDDPATFACIINTKGKKLYG